MSKVIVWQRPDGGMTVCAPCPNDRREGETEDSWMDRVRRKSVPASATHVRICDTAEIPNNRRWRECWDTSNGKVEINIAKARGQRLKEIRSERGKRLLATDAEMMRAQERNSPDVETLKSKRQTLRDIPQTITPVIDAASTPAELESIEPQWPA